MKSFIAHIAQYINPFTNNFHKETAMKNLIRKAAAGMAVFTVLSFASVASAQSRAECIATCKGDAKGTWKTCMGACPAEGAGPKFKTCSNGKKVPVGQACPGPKFKTCSNGKKVPVGQACPKVGGPIKVTCGKNATKKGGACHCNEGFEHFGDVCVPECDSGEKRDSEGVCKLMGACEDPCFQEAAREDEKRNAEQVKWNAEQAKRSERLVAAMERGALWAFLCFLGICALFLLSFVRLVREFKKKAGKFPPALPPQVAKPKQPETAPVHEPPVDA